jgi:MATE family multidrug resistance protein
MTENSVSDSGRWRSEARALLALSIPLVIGNIGWAAIAATDLLLLGHLGPDAVAAGALGINLHTAFMIFGIGLTTAASPLIASERGRKLHSVRDIRRTVRQTMWAAIMLCLPCWLVLWHAEAILIMIGQEPELAAAAGHLVHGVQWALLPYFLYLALRNFVSSLERPMWGVIVMVATMPFNALMGWILIFGHFGMPAMGLFGAGIASSLSACFMFVGMAIVVLTDRASAAIICSAASGSQTGKGCARCGRSGCRSRSRSASRSRCSMRRYS